MFVEVFRCFVVVAFVRKVMAFVVLGRGAGAVGRAVCSVPSARFGSSLVFGKHGKPTSVLRVNDAPTPSPSNGEVVVKMVAAPVSLADFDNILGVAPGAAPGVAGCGGVGVVEAVGAGSKLAVGDYIIPNGAGFGGTWRSHAVVSDNVVDKIPSSLAPEAGATLGGACTAFRLLNDFVGLKKGDVVIQNGSGVVGEAVVQMAKERGLKTVSVVKGDQVEKFKKLGGDVVVDENTLRSSEFSKVIAGVGQPKLALNGEGGISATEISRLLCNGGTFVTYGNSSRLHLKITPSSLIFNNVEFRGFDLSRWNAAHSKEEREAMVKEVGALVEGGKVKVSAEKVKFGEWEKALEKAAGGESVVLVM